MIDQRPGPVLVFLEDDAPHEQTDIRAVASGDISGAVYRPLVRDDDRDVRRLEPHRPTR
jgi:hypothetical protein